MSNETMQSGTVEAQVNSSRFLQCVGGRQFPDGSQNRWLKCLPGSDISGSFNDTNASCFVYCTLPAIPFGSYTGVDNCGPGLTIFVGTECPMSCILGYFLASLNVAS
eukprot:25815_1